jgi:cytochrome c peroxidase
MHDGRFKTLEEVIEFYDNGVNVNSPNVSPFMSNLHRPGGSLNLTQHEKDALVAFLKTLTDQEFVSNPDFLP